METGLVIAAIVLIVILIGVLYALLTKTHAKQKNTSGTLYVSFSESDNAPGLFLELDVPVEDVVSQKQIVLRVNTIRNNSHE
jgi:hypothetical protein